uniref:Uncharacterized protein n=1 Tax=Canis lupus familiaris TaxID=9615 RepID=A0A8C0P834_CANLF
MPLRGPSDACFTTFLMSSYLAAFSRRQVRSTTDTLGVGTRKAMPVSLPFSSGMMFWAAPRPSRHSFPEGPSTVFWVAVMAWTVVMRPSTMPKWSWMTLARGAKQLVVQEALLTILRELSYFSWFTPITNMVVKTPVDSTTYSAPASPHLMLAGSRSWKMEMDFPLMTSFPFSALTVLWNLPWVESYWNMYTM